MRMKDLRERYGALCFMVATEDCDFFNEITDLIFEDCCLEAEILFPEKKAASRRKATVRHNQKIAKRNSSLCDLVNPSKRMSRIDYDNANRKRCRELMLLDKRNAKEANDISDYQKLFNNFHQEVFQQYL